ncbi:DNA helicase UvrD [Bifidobacterium primatium]|uniref:DNA helicase UvrD n=1 Tax=Bifidobacterium primatium TaxID=2045438 RepID=A0A2M9H9R2_9BIFI|nr:PD-(D/E)XK nuclease family protein [Bifidobacterium primatium]PJM73553.1 DNA helicase UvrD [Bifidobacterium primatium]
MTMECTRDEALQLAKRLYIGMLGRPADGIGADGGGTPSDDGQRTFRDDDAAQITNTLLVAGAPRSGKTDFAFVALLAALDEYGDDAAVMTVSGRVAADDLGNKVIEHIGATSQARPVTTLSALAFRMISAARSHADESAPRLLNGAEQDSLLRSVLAVHVAHVQAGDQCATCRLLGAYFAESHWAGLVAADADTRPASDRQSMPSISRSISSGQSSMNGKTTPNGRALADGQTDGPQRTDTTDALLIRGISDAFVNQLRDMLARMNELGVTPDREDAIIETLADEQGEAGVAGERLAAQWRLAFALRREYQAAVLDAYPDEYRLDASQLLAAGARAAADTDAADLPRAVIVDDAQDMTLAAMAFLQTLERRGCKLVLVGNPDEAVQGFRGSYPEFLFLRAVQPAPHAMAAGDDDAAGTIDDRNLGRLGALAVTLRNQAEDRQVYDVGESPHMRGNIAVNGHDDAVRQTDATTIPAAPSYLDLVASRISLGILSVEANPRPVARRLGKTPQYRGAMPVVASDETRELSKDGTIHGSLYRSAGEELDDVVWHVKRAHMVEGRSWNDMAVIAHDNATVRVFGERLRREGVPVRYSTVTRPLKEEPFVQGLFSMIELARLRNEGLAGRMVAGGMSGPRVLAALVRSRMRTLLTSPLIAVQRGNGSRPMRVDAIASALRSLESLSRVVGPATDAPASAAATSAADDKASDDMASDGNAALLSMMTQWRALSDALSSARSDERNDTGIVVDDSVFNDDTPTDAMQFNADAMLLLLAQGGVGADQVLRSVHAVLGGRGGHTDPEAAAFARAWGMIGELAESMRTMPVRESQYVLWQAWQTSAVAERWQREALENTENGRAANDRLDAAMRLFQFSESSGAKRDIMAFIDQVRNLEIEADSLAHVGPVEQAVTLTTPAGAIGRHWRLVWLPAIQQGVWPNLAARNTMFGTEDLADVMLHGRIGTIGGGDIASGRSERLASVLYTEKKSLLVALTRADGRAYVSAVADDDHTPSDFLYGFMPERFRRTEEPEYVEVGQEGAFSGLEFSARGIVAAARATLARYYRNAEADGFDAADSTDAADAARTLAYLAEHGESEADPAHWPFLHTASQGVPSENDYISDDAATNDADAASVGSPNAAVFAMESLPTGVPAKERERFSDDDGKTTVVTLSPSAVDGIWNCPVCWLMDNRFAGPRPSGVASGFGTIIHAVAERASAEHLDLPEQWDGMMRDDAVQRITDRMVEIYQELRVDPDDAASVAERYAALRKDRSATGLLRHIAEYFVDSNDSVYAATKKTAIPVGTLVAAECEKPFVARFGLDDIVRAYNAVPDREPVDADELYAIMGALVGEWPQGMRPDIGIRISGRMDRMEVRRTEDGHRQIRLIDYKTGRTRTAKQGFSDLQLVCYQLGLLFDEQARRGGGTGSGVADVDIAQSGLFFVADNASPSNFYGPEGCHQPALFRDGHLNADGFLPRNRVGMLSRLFDDPELPAMRPDDVGEAAWRRLLGERGTQTLWALTMIARVFYAAGAVESQRLVAHPDPAHVDGCWHKDSCPACADDITSVLEVRS